MLCCASPVSDKGVSDKGVVWIVDAKPLLPSPSHLRNTRRSARGSGRPPVVADCSDVPGLSSSSLMGYRSPTLLRWSDSTGAMCTNGHSDFWSSASRDWRTNLGVATSAYRAKLPRRSSTWHDLQGAMAACSMRSTFTCHALAPHNLKDWNRLKRKPQCRGHFG